MDLHDYASIRTIIRLPDEAIHSLYRCGSHVYDTAGPRSDEDFVAVLSSPDAKRDLVLGRGCDVVLQPLSSFQEALARGSVFSLECIFAPSEHRLKETRGGFSIAIDRRAVAAAALARAKSDFDKAARRFADDPSGSKKKLFHALRVPAFALQIAREGRIVDYREMSPLWSRISADPEPAWEAYRRAYGPLYERLTAALLRLSRA